MTLPLGGRIALPSSINTYISVIKNTSLMYVIGYAELTTTAINISNLTLQTTEALTVLAIVYLTLVWTPLVRRSAGSSGTSRSRRRADARLVGPGLALRPPRGAAEHAPRRRDRRSSPAR